MVNGRLLISAILASSLLACSSDDGGGSTTPPPSNGLILSKTATVGAYKTKSYSFTGKQYKAYSGRIEVGSGDVDLDITKQSSLYSTMDSTSASSGIGDVSFIAPTTETLAARVTGDYWASTSSFKLKIYNNHLTVDGASRERVTRTQPLYFSFDAEAGKAYKVTVTPTSGDPDLSVYSGTTSSYSYESLLPDSSTLIGTSDNTGLQEESIVFLASESKIHYVAVDNNLSSDLNFTVSVESSTASPDLQVSVDSLSYSDSTNQLTVNYTVSNTGAANSTVANLHFWLDSATVPTAGTTGDDQVSITGIGPGETYSSSRSIDVGALELGTVYAYIDPEGAVSEADETNNVSAAKQWAAPILAPQSFDFEDSLKPAVFTYSADASWATVPGGANGTSSYSFRSGRIGANEGSCFQVVVEGVDTVTYDWKALTDTSGDYLRFYVNGYSQQTYSGANTWVSKTFSPYSSGINTFKWCYYKGTTDNTAVDDAGWVDNIVFQPELPDLTVTIDSVTSDGANLTVGYTVDNNSTAAAEATTVDFWADASVAPTVGTSGTVQNNVPVIAGNGSYSGTATVPSVLTSGTLYAIVDTSNTVSEKDETNNVSSGKPWIYYGIPLAEYGFEDGLFPAAFVASGNVGWEIDATTASSGTYSIRASDITHSQTACVAISVASSTMITFDWKVSSESYYDPLIFYIDGVEQTGRISGSTAWASKEYTTTTGTHEYKWCYTKDHIDTVGSDTGWVDNIRVY